MNSGIFIGLIASASFLVMTVLLLDYKRLVWLMLQASNLTVLFVMSGLVFW